MTNPLSDLLKKDTDLATVKDVVQGGGGFVKDTGVYMVKVNHAYMEESSGGGVAIQLSFKHADENKTNFNITEYPTSGIAKGKKNYFISKQGEKVLLAGYVKVDDMIRIATNGAVDLEHMTCSPKTVEVYDFASGGKINKEVQHIDQLDGAIFKLALHKCTVNKYKDKAPIADTKEVNEIDKVFGQDGKTIREREAGAPAEIEAKWLDKNPDTLVKDKRTIKTAPASGSALGATSSPAASAEDTTDLFGTD